MPRPRTSFSFNGRNMNIRLENARQGIDRELKAVADYTAIEGTAYMKEEAPWTDRTGNARAGLHAEVQDDLPRKIDIVFAGTVHYQIWLEIANSGQYQIIMPTVRREGNLIMGRLTGLLGRIQ